MAINLTEDINHSGGGKIVSVAQSAGSWQSLTTKATFSNFTANTTTKQNLTNGQFFYVLDEGQLYRLTVAGVGPFATFTLNSASLSDINTGSFVTNNQTSSMSVATASFVNPTFISASAAAAGFGSGGGTATDISSLNTFTGSAQTSLTALNSATSSYALKTDVSGAFTSVSSSTSTRLTSLEGTISGDVTESIVTSVVTNNGSSYYIIDDIEKPKLSFAPGLTYRFNLSGIVGSHPFKFSTSLNGPTQYTTGVTSGSGFIQIEVGYNTTSPLYYYCTNHSGMGNEINVLQIEKLITNSQTSSMSVLSALTASFISDAFISASAVRSGFGSTLFPSGLLSSSIQIAGDISGAFTSLSSSFASRITTLEGAGGGNGIFTLTGSFFSTTNDIQITGSLSIGSGSFKSFEVNSDGFIVLGEMDKDLNNAPEGTISYSGSNFYLIF